jgi:hypothetical protein
VARSLAGGVRSHREDLAAATAVQIAWSCRLGSQNIEHIGSVHDDGEFEALRAARRRLAAGRVELDPATLRRVDVLARGRAAAHALD